MKNYISIGCLVSGSGSNLQAIIDACARGNIHGQVTFVGSDNPDAFGIIRAANSGIPTFVLDYTAIIEHFSQTPTQIAPPEDFDIEDILSKQSIFSPDTSPEKRKHFLTSRAIVEAALLEKINAYPFDLLVLAGFMRILTPYFIDRINLDDTPPRIMNIHPALLPAFPGTDGYGDTLWYGCKVAGCTVHFVDYGKDSGPIIAQKAFAILEEDTLKTIKEKGIKLEWEVYPKCIHLFAENRLQVIYPTFHGKQGKKPVVKILPETQKTN
jgi:phosphoribosylglycinamide formyltransferase-1